MGIGLFIVLAISVWIYMPYIIPSKNLISRYGYDYTYTQAIVHDFDKLEYSTRIDSVEADKVEKLINVIDELPLKKTWKPSEWYYDGIFFIATYKEGESSTYTKEVFAIRFFEDNVIGFNEKPQYRVRYYKIQDEEFNINKVIEELKEGKN